MPLPLIRMFVTMLEVRIPLNDFDEEALIDNMDQSGESGGPRRKNSYIPSLEGLAAMFSGQNHAGETMDFAGDDSETFSNAGSTQSYLDELDQPGPKRLGPPRRRSVFHMMSAPDPSQLEIPDKHKEPSRRVSHGDAPRDLKALHQLEANARHGMVQNSILNWLAFRPQNESIREDNELSSSPQSAFHSPSLSGNTSTPLSEAAVKFTAGPREGEKGLRSLNAMAPSAW